MTDFSTVTACGESCLSCGKRLSGACPGCIEADGRVPEWAESGRCRVHACARDHNARYCFLCTEFPCPRLAEMYPWREDAVSRLVSLRGAYLRGVLEEESLPSFAVIGFEGSTDEGPGMVASLWSSANSRFAEIAPLVKKSENGAPLRVWGLMSDPSRSFRPWEDGFRRGLYLAGAECPDDAVPPEGWVKWVAPAARYLRFSVEGDAQAAFRLGLEALRAAGYSLAGAAFDCTVPSEGRSWVYFPVRREP